MVENESLIDQLQRHFYETHDRKYLDRMYDIVDWAVYHEELFENDWTEVATEFPRWELNTTTENAGPVRYWLVVLSDIAEDLKLKQIPKIKHETSC